MSGLARAAVVTALGVLVAGTASAESMTAEEFDARFAGIVGHVGAQVGANYAREVDGSGPEEDIAPHGVVDLSMAYRSASGFTFGMEGALRFDHFGGTIAEFFADYEVPALQGVLALHALSGQDGWRIGMFGQIGASLPVSYDWNDAYAYWLAGFSGQLFLADNVLVYKQIGFGNKLAGADSENEGFVRGMVLRGGMTYFASTALALNADFEFARSKNYIDSSDPGRHFGFSFGAQRQIGQSGLFVNAEASYAIFNAPDEGDGIEEYAFALGVDYVFGAQSVRDRWVNGLAIGSPRLPVRAGAWTEWLD